MPKLTKPNFNISLGRRGSAALVGLDIQPGYVAAVQAHVNGSIVVQHAAGLPLAPDAMREGEVLDEQTLSETLRELFADGRLGRRVRIGLANQRTVLRTLEMPPVSDRKELAAAVRFQAEDQVPMPLAAAVLDYHSLGIIDTPAGPRQRVIVVAAQREMVQRLLNAVRAAGLRPEGVDLSAFALIRSLYSLAEHADPQQPERVLYLNVGGLTNMAIAEGTVCRFTRVIGGGLEAMASEIAERRGIPLVQARALLAAADLTAVAQPPQVVAPAPSPALPEPVVADGPEADHGLEADHGHEGFGAPGGEAEPSEPPALETWALAQDPNAGSQPAPNAGSQPAQPAAAAPSHDAAPSQLAQEQPPAAPAVAPSAAVAAMDPDVRMVLENGIREIVGELRNSLDFHRSQDGGGEVTNVVVSGPALEMPGFVEALQADLGMEVRRASVHLGGGDAFDRVSTHRLAIAAGLAAEEVHR
jgi:type IV pilus assembly protein PilM